MTLVQTAPLAVPRGAVCAIHHEAPAVATCVRCGGFACADCTKLVSGRTVCAACFARPEVDYLGEFERKMWGKRDGYIWWFGLVGSLATGAVLALTVVAAVAGDFVSGVVALVIGAQLAVFGCYFFQMKWARAGLFGILGLNLTALAFVGPEALAGGAAQQILPLLFFVTAWNSARNQLAFRIEVPEAKLKKLYDTYYDNQVARAGMLLGLLSTFIPGLALLSLPLSIVGLRRVNPDSWPPVGRKKTAIAGIVLSVLGLLVTGALVFVLVA